MAKTLVQEIKQSRPFDAIEFTAFLSLQRTADVLMNRLTVLLKDYDMSFSQFNILRILRGTPEGLPVGEISARMVRREPDLTRLLDRLENRRFVIRSRESRDRRVVTARIVDAGLRILEELDPQVEGTEKAFFVGIDESKLIGLIELLDELREN